jgi:predicted nucleotidyltransferase
MIYSVDQLKELVEPIAKKYNLKALWVFGSYARGEATEESDVDFLIDDSDSKALDLNGFIDMADEFEQIFNKKIDLIPVENLNAPTIKKYRPKLVEFITNEKVILYEKS